MNKQSQFTQILRTIEIVALVLTFALTIIAQTSNETQTLLSGQTIEREMTGAETHRYKFDLKANEFFQVRVEQKGVDVTLKLLDAAENVLVMMNSPNGKEGFETLTFVSSKSENFFLDVISPNEKAEKGTYVIKRETSRPAIEKDKQRIEAERDFVEAIKVLNTDRQTSLDKLKKALKGWQEVGDVEMEKMTVPWADFQTMLLVLDEGQILVQKAQQIFAEERTKSSLELLNESKEKILKADSKFRQAGILAQNIITDYPEFSAKNPALKNFPYLAKAGQITVASFLSTYYQYLLEPQKQLQYALLASTIAKESRMMNTTNSGINDESKVLNDAQALLHLASAMQENNNPEAIKFYEQTLSVYRELKKTGSSFYNIKQEAQLIVSISQLYSYFCKESISYCSQKTVEYSQQAIAIYETLDDKEAIVRLQLTISTAYYELNELYKSLEFTGKALTLAQSLENKELVSQSLFSKSALFTLLGNKLKAAEFYKQGLDITLLIPSYAKDIDSASMPPFEKRNRLRMEYRRLIGIAGNYSQIEEYLQAIKYYTEAVEIAHLLEDKSHEAHSLANIGSAYRDLKDWQQALNYYQKSVLLFTEIGEKRRQSDILVDMAIVHLELKNPKEALPLLIQAQQIYSSIKVDDSGVTNILAKAWYALGKRRLGIFYGKKLVYWIQTQRQKLSDFDRETQQNFVNSFEKPIRRLADWLIEEGQFAQAERVLRMLKEEEYSGFVRRDANEIKTLNQRIELDDTEKKLLEKYTRLTDDVSKIGQEFYRLEQKQIQLREKGLELNEADAKLIKEKSEQLETARLAFNTFLDKELVKEIGETRKADIDTQKSRQEVLRDLPKGTVTLYTMVGEDRYRVILTTPDIQVDGKYEIKATELNKKVFAFREALQNPNVDPRPLGKELYDILIKPIEKDLKNSEAKTLLWYLDGILRYIPIAALSPDGKRYLLEDFQNVILTAKTGNLDSQGAGASWKVLGLGVSNAQTMDNPFIPQEKISFDALPGTKRELISIISDENAKNEKGILPGRRFLDENFTVANFENSLNAKKFNVVHLASHFYLGNKDANSFLLLGNGQILPLSKFEAGSFIRFGGVDLVTLSACNTAFANTSNGSEVDSLADVIQSRGGKSVLATLWSVADESTSLLMSEFYRLKKKNPNMTKAEAIQAAQKAMIEGKLKSANTGNLKGAEIVGTTNSKVNMPPFSFDKNKPFAHPFYWSPFVLIGNWK